MPATTAQSDASRDHDIEVARYRVIYEQTPISPADLQIIYRRVHAIMFGSTASAPRQDLPTRDR